MSARATSLQTALAACIIATSVPGFAGQIVLNGTSGTVSFTNAENINGTPANVISIGSNNCSSVCTLSGVAMVAGFELGWSVEELNPANATSPTQLYTYSYTANDTPTPNMGAGTVSNPTNVANWALLTVTDALDDGSDVLTAGLSLSTLAQNGAADGMTLNGSVNIASGGVTLSGAESALFKGALELAGVTFTGSSVNAASLPASLAVINCMNSSTPSACILTPDPVGTVSGFDIGTASGVPEPGTLSVLAGGIVVMAIKRRLNRPRFKND